MGGGRVPGPTSGGLLGDDPFGSGFTDPEPLGGGDSAGGAVTLAGWPRTLTWENFREVDSAPDGGVEAAQIHPEAIQPAEVRVTREGGTLRLSAYTVRVRIVRDDTWVVTSQKSDTLLIHEQGHFDIVGLTARDMVADLAALRASSAAELQSLVRDTIARAGTLATTIDRTYDGTGSDGTANGSNSGVQGRWNAHLRNCRENNVRLTGAPPSP